MRGKEVLQFCICRLNRITPAYAGKSCHCRCRTCDSRDHPCVCGEKQASQIYHRRHKGSPLRMRGKAIKLGGGAKLNRITPAYAGKRNVSAVIADEIGDHPCVCGEKKLPCPDHCISAGSPLRMRGKVQCLTLCV